MPHHTILTTKIHGQPPASSFSNGMLKLRQLGVTWARLILLARKAHHRPHPEHRSVLHCMVLGIIFFNFFDDHV
jgi:hypothetical protein